MTTYLHNDELEQIRTKLSQYSLVLYKTKGLKPPWKQQVHEDLNRITDFIIDLYDYSRNLEAKIRLLEDKLNDGV